MSANTTARIVGALYLVLALTGGFSELYVRRRIVVSSDVAATAANVAENATLMRLGFAADLLNITLFLLVALVLYRMLHPINPRVALAMVAFNAVAAAVMSLNMLNHLGALLVASRPAYTAALSPGSSDALVALLLDMHSHGYLVAQIFFGLWLLPLGYLVRISGYLPKVLGLLLMFGGTGYLADVVATISSPDLASSLSPYLTMPAGLAEVLFLGWMLVRGVGKSLQVPPVLAPA